MHSHTRSSAAMALLFVVAGLAGCFSHPAIYPDNWAQRQASGGDECPDLDGAYRNAGEARPPEALPQARSLAHILNGGTGVDSLELANKLGPTHEDPNADPNDIVRLWQADGVLRVTASRQDGSGRSMDLPVRAGCRDGLLELEADWDTDVELISPVAPEFSRKSIALGRAGDGSLLVRESKAALQWFLLAPAFGYREAEWIRFDAMPAPAAAQAEGSP